MEDLEKDEIINDSKQEEILCSFEFNVKNTEEDEAFLAFQKKYVYKKNIIKSVGFGLLAVGFAVSAYRDPSVAFNYILTGICLAAIVAIWYNMKHIRKSLMEALKMLEDDRYIFTLYQDRFVIETIVTEEEKAEEDFTPIPPQAVELSDNALDVEEQEDKFILIIKKETIYVLPKRCMNNEQIKAVRDTLKIKNERE